MTFNSNSVVHNRGAATQGYNRKVMGVPQVISRDIRPILAPGGAAKYLNNPIMTQKVENAIVYTYTLFDAFSGFG